MFDHDFEKMNLVTIKKGLAFYDLLKCKKCGKEVKRYGLTTETYGCKVPDEEIEVPFIDDWV